MARDILTTRSSRIPGNPKWKVQVLATRVFPPLSTTASVKEQLEPALQGNRIRPRALFVGPERGILQG